MEHYAFGGVLGLMTCAFGWAAFGDWNCWRRPWWGWLCGVCGLLSLGRFTWGMGAPLSWWLVLALASAAGLLWLMQMIEIYGVTFNEAHLRSKGSFEARCKEKGLDVATLLRDPGVLLRLAACTISAWWAAPIAAEKIPEIERSLTHAQKNLDDLKQVLQNLRKAPVDQNEDRGSMNYQTLVSPEDPEVA